MEEDDEGREASTTFRGPHTDGSSRTYGETKREREREREEERYQSPKQTSPVVFGKTSSGK